ncbi:hypothetical protein SFC08_03890 [Lysinibacillus halotolerans]|uniref:Uncharacterized protein n=1 Tax=Lysinibacillus halotolerans TaxID=1368476 RepID=A0A3M8H7N7_9BACI|nr:hypothetical protein EC501_11315 [Lysinibacillus halotolerans]
MNTATFSFPPLRAEDKSSALFFIFLPFVNIPLILFPIPLQKFDYLLNYIKVENIVALIQLKKE